MQPHILLPLDSSVEAEPLLPVAALASATRSRLHLLYVIDPPYATVAGIGFIAVLPSSQYLALISRAYRHLQTIARHLQNEVPGVEIQITVLEGDQIGSVLDTIKRVPGASVLALAPRKRVTSFAFFERNVVAALAQCTSLPLLYVPSTPREMHTPALSSSGRSILVPFFKGDGLHAVEAAAEIASMTGAVIALVTVVEDIRNASRMRRWPPSAQRQSRQLQLQSKVDCARTYLEALAYPLRSRGLSVQVEVTCGQPAEEIVRLCHLHDFNIIVATAARQNSIRRFFSRHARTLQQIIHTSKAPVMLVKRSPIRPITFTPAHPSLSLIEKARGYDAIK